MNLTEKKLARPLFMIIQKYTVFAILRRRYKISVKTANGFKFYENFPVDYTYPLIFFYVEMAIFER